MEAYHREDITGRWNDNNCAREIGYVCQKPKDSSLSDGKQINNNKKCPFGWMQVRGTILAGSICDIINMFYMIKHENKHHSQYSLNQCVNFFNKL